MTAVCSTCAAPIGPKNRSGLCRGCVARRANADPVHQAKRREGIIRKMQEPEFRAACIARLVERNTNLSDAERERRRTRGRTLAPILIEAAKNLSPETRAENGRKRSATVMAWCPPEWRPKYHDLTKRGRRAADAKRIVLDLIAGKPMPVAYAQQKARLAWCPPGRLDEYRRFQKSMGSAEARRIIEADLTPFERQLAKVAAGATLVSKPDFRTAGPSYSLVGNATGML